MGKSNSKKVKRYENSNPCEDHSVPARKRRLNEIQSLNTDGCDVKGGRVVGINAGLPPSIYDDITVTRSLRTRDSQSSISYNEDYCVDEDAFDDYLRLVNECTIVAHSTASPDVKAEGPSMINKMRGLLHPSVKSEVDYEEAAKDARHAAYTHCFHSCNKKLKETVLLTHRAV